MSRRINDCGDWVVLRAYTNYCVNAYLLGCSFVGVGLPDLLQGPVVFVLNADRR